MENKKIERGELSKDFLKEFEMPVDEFSKTFIEKQGLEFLSLKSNLIDKISPFKEIRSKGYFNYEDYQVKVRDLDYETRTGKLIFIDHKSKFSDIQHFNFDVNQDIVKQLKRPSKKLFRRIKKQVPR